MKKGPSKLEDKIAAIWDGESDYLDFGVEVTFRDNVIEVAVSQMYEYVPANFTHMKALSELFGTDEINLNNWSSCGCETCDYGSQYVQEFTITNPTKELDNV